MHLLRAQVKWFSLMNVLQGSTMTLVGIVGVALFDNENIIYCSKTRNAWVTLSFIGDSFILSNVGGFIGNAATTAMIFYNVPRKEGYFGKPSIGEEEAKRGVRPGKSKKKKVAGPSAMSPPLLSEVKESSTEINTKRKKRQKVESETELLPQKHQSKKKFKEDSCDSINP